MNKPITSLLIIDDDKFFCRTLEDHFSKLDINIFKAHDGNSGVAICSENRIDVLLLDQKLPDGEGHTFCKTFLNYNDKTKIIFITAYPNFNNSLKAIENGAFSYLSKPLDMKELNHTVDKCLRIIELERKEENLSYKNSRESRELILIGKSEKLSKVKDLIDAASLSEKPVLITGETGTGKNLVAKLMHYRSRRKGPFISINCSTLPENLIEMELFGYEKGAFTGASSEKKGLFEIADKGSIFLDEIGEMHPSLQAKLLSVLDDRKVRRIGGVISRFFDVRIIASTNADIEKNIKNRSFREDLYYRLNILRIHLPPLRERCSDIPILINYFLKTISPNKRYYIEKDESEILINYKWKGNIRELKNIIERSIIISKDRYLNPSKILCDKDFISLSSETSNLADVIPLEKYEIDYIKKVLIKFNYNLTRTSKALGISLSTLKRKVNKYNLKTNSSL